MPARQVCQNFFRDTLAPFHKYRQNALLATLSTIVLWLLGYHTENKGLHLRYQANSLKSRRVISYLTLAENILDTLR